MEARAGGRLAAEEAGGDRPSSHRFLDPNLCLGSRYRPAIGNHYEAAFEPGSGCGGRWQIAEKAAPKNLEAAEKKAAPMRK